MYVGRALFIGSDLSSFLDRHTHQVRYKTEQFVKNSGASRSIDQIVSELSAQLFVKPLNVNFEDVEKNVVSAKVTVKDFNREIIIDGARATRTYPFTGNSDLFSLKPSTYYSVLPYGDVTQNRVTIGLEGRPDAEMLKRELDTQEKLLKDYLANSTTQIEAYNKTIESEIRAVVEHQLKHLKNIDDLKGKL